MGKSDHRHYRSKSCSFFPEFLHLHLHLYFNIHLLSIPADGSRIPEEGFLLSDVLWNLYFTTKYRRHHTDTPQWLEQDDFMPSVNTTKIMEMFMQPESLSSLVVFSHLYSGTDFIPLCHLDTPHLGSTFVNHRRGKTIKAKYHPAAQNVNSQQPLLCCVVALEFIKCWNLGWHPWFTLSLEEDALHFHHFTWMLSIFKRFCIRKWK